MNAGRLIFSQLMDFVPLSQFQKCVQRYNGNYKVQRFSCLDQFLCLAFAQLTYRESLREIETCLRAIQPRLYHMGIRGNVARSTLADANEKRDWRIYADFAQVLISRARRLYAHDELDIGLDSMVYALDSTTIDLCLSLFPWAQFRKGKGAIKLHTLLDLRGPIPSFLSITDGLVHDVNILDEIVPEPGAYYIMDRAYLDYSRLYSLHQNQSFFVIRARRRFRFQRSCSRPTDKSLGLRCDQTVLPSNFYPAKAYPEKLRRICFFDADTGTRFVFLTNNFALSAYTITQIYRCRWQVELFFKWIKQHLRIKSFFGTSPNAVKTQIWTAVAVYVLVAIVRKQLDIPASLYTILQILSLTLFEKVPLDQLLMECGLKLAEPKNDNQLLIVGL